jgi:hypothetical protein
MKRITLVVGHYGSGKTEFSVNLAIDTKKEHEKVALVDLDIANPYFRSRERQKMLEERGIDIHYNTYGYDITEDMPALSATIRAPLENKEYITIADVGGNDSGAMVLNQFRKYFVGENSKDCDMLCVINANRPETSDVQGALMHIARIQNETGIPVTGLINNTHLLRETSADDIIKGYELCKEITKETGLPLVYNTCVKELLPELEAAKCAKNITDLVVYPMDLYMRPTWLDR